MKFNNWQSNDFQKNYEPQDATISLKNLSCNILRFRMNSNYLLKICLENCPI